MSTEVLNLLNYMLQAQASDLHLKVGSSPYIRVNTRLERTNLSALTVAAIDTLASEIIPPAKASAYEATGEVSFAVGYQGLGRFRVSVLRQRGTTSIVFRRVVNAVPSFEALGFPHQVRQLSESKNGLILVTGPADSGKSTTIATMLNHINENSPVSIVTVENPIEILHADRTGFVSQREVGIDTPTLLEGFRHCLNHDPDVIYIDRIDSVELIEAALDAATSRLVITTMSTLNATETVGHIVSSYPERSERQVRHGLAAVLQGIISQRLLERQDGRGRVGAFEMLVTTPRIHDSIIQSPGCQDIESLVAAGEYNGMKTIDQHLTELYRSGVIGMREAISAATHPRDMRVALQHA